MNKIIQKIKRAKNTKIIKKSITIYWFIVAIITSVTTQILHCFFFYYSRAFFINILEQNTYTLFFDIEQYILLLLSLILYGLFIKYLHTYFVNKYVKNKIKGALLEDILLGWKYFVFLFAFLYKLVFASFFFFLFYIFLINIILWQKNSKKVIITVYSILLMLHIYVLTSSDLAAYGKIFLLLYSSIYFAISPCYNTLIRIRNMVDTI
jgi:hypothetical protein